MGLATNSFALMCIKRDPPPVGRLCAVTDAKQRPGFQTPTSGQSRTASLVESITNIAAGIGVAFISQEIIFTWYGIHLSAASNAQIVAWFTAISLVRQFCLRRIFNWLTLR